MRLGGLRKLSLIDFPGIPSCVVFTLGCNFRCLYCHNPELVLTSLFDTLLDEEEFFRFLSERRGMLEGVVVSGGEPTIHQDLPCFLERVKRLGFKIKLDTNGSNPTMLRTLLDEKLCDYIAMDIKAGKDNYAKVAGVPVDQTLITESTDLIRVCGIDHEFRITLVKSLHSAEEIRGLVTLFGDVRKFTIRGFVPSDKILDPKILSEDSFTEAEIDSFRRFWEEGPATDRSGSPKDRRHFAPFLLIPSIFLCYISSLLPAIILKFN